MSLHSAPPKNVRLHHWATNFNFSTGVRERGRTSARETQENILHNTLWGNDSSTILHNTVDPWKHHMGLGALDLPSMWNFTSPP